MGNYFKLGTGPSAMALIVVCSKVSAISSSSEEENILIFERSKGFSFISREESPKSCFSFLRSSFTTHESHLYSIFLIIEAELVLSYG